MPHLLDIQTRRVPDAPQSPTTSTATGRTSSLERVFRDLFPITRREREVLARVRRLPLGEPKYTVEECIERDMTYAAPLKATLQLGRQRGSRGRRSGRRTSSRRKSTSASCRIMTPLGHVRHQRRRARRGEPAAPLAGRGVRGEHPPQRPAAVLGADHPVPRLVGRVHDRHPRRDLRPHRQEEEVPGHGAAARLRLRRRTRRSCGCSSRPRSSTSPASSRAGRRSARCSARCWPSDVPNPEEPKGDAAGRGGRRAHPRAPQRDAARGRQEGARCSPATPRSTCATTSSPTTTRDRHDHVLAFDVADPETGEILAEAGAELTDALRKKLLKAGVNKVDVLLPPGRARVAADQEHAAQGPDPERGRGARADLRPAAPRRGAEPGDRAAAARAAVLQPEALRPRAGWAATRSTSGSSSRPTRTTPSSPRTTSSRSSAT